jgi:O-methyltransferase involved in polyketide biosynthesis
VTDVANDTGAKPATAARIYDPAQILADPRVRELIDFDQPIALILGNVLHFLPDEVAYGAVATLVSALPAGSMLAINHGNIEEIEKEVGSDDIEIGHDVYRQRTTTPIHMRTRAQIERFFGGHPLVEPGLVYVPSWRPDPAHPSEFEDNPAASGGLGAVARLG